MEEKKITKAEFDAAVVAATEKMSKDENLTGMAAILVPMTGMLFAIEMRDILFQEDKTEVNKEC